MKKLLIALFIIGAASSAQGAIIPGQTDGVDKHTVEEFGQGDSLVAQGKILDTTAVLTDVLPTVASSSADNTDGLVAGFIHDYVFIAVANTFVTIASAVQLTDSTPGTFISPLVLQVFHQDGLGTLLGSGSVGDEATGNTRSTRVTALLAQGETYVVRMSNEGGTALGSDPNYTLKVISAVPVPAAVWLFGTALLGLFGYKRKAQAAAAA